MEKRENEPAAAALPIEGRRRPPMTGSMTARQIGFVVGLVLAVGLQLLPPPDGLSREGWVTASLAVLMATWWATEAIPIPATALLPLVVLPLAGIASMPEAAAPYASPTVLLFLGGFVLALGLERWRLHERVALNVVARSGGRPRGLVLGFMIATALISMWISNTAAALMIVPIALSVAQVETGETAGRGPFAAALLLGVVYACSIGGVATPVGTPTNLIAIGYLEQSAGVSVSFLQWMAIGVPIAAIFTPIAWLILTRVAFKLDAVAAGAATGAVRERLACLGPLTAPELRVALVFGTVAALWILRQPALDLLTTGLERDGLEKAGRWRSLNGTNGDALVAIAGAIALFLVPAGGRSGAGRALMDWETASRLPWGVVLLFGGGLSLAAAIDASGLAAWLGGQLTGLAAFPTILIVLAVVIVIVFASELASNVATVTVFMPVVGALAGEGGFDLVALAIPAALAGSYAFMLPVGTPPNAIAYATGRVGMAEMIGAGFRLNLAAIVVITIGGVLLAPLVLG